MKLFIYSAIFAALIYFGWEAAEARGWLAMVAFILALNVFEARENIKMLNERISDLETKIFKLEDAEQDRKLMAEYDENTPYYED